MQSKIIFIHISKTGGTSLRESFEKAGTPHERIYDYGVTNPRTTEAYKHYMAKTEDREQLAKDVAPKDVFLSGHFPARKWAQIFGEENCITIIRHPVHRLVSLYNHHVNHMDYEGSPLDFVQERRNINPLTKSLRNVDVNKLGFVGIFEHYESELVKLSKHLKIALPLLRANTGNYLRHSKNELLKDKQLIDAIMDLNTMDLGLYWALLQKKGYPMQPNINSAV